MPSLHQEIDDDHDDEDDDDSPLHVRTSYISNGSVTATLDIPANADNIIEAAFQTATA